MSYKDQHHSNQVSSSIRVSGYNCDTEIQWPYHWRDPSVVSIHAKRDQHINQCNSQQSKLQNRSLHSENTLNSNCISYACKRKPLFVNLPQEDTYSKPHHQPARGGCKQVQLQGQYGPQA